MNKTFYVLVLDDDEQARTSIKYQLDQLKSNWPKMELLLAGSRLNALEQLKSKKLIPDNRVEPLVLAVLDQQLNDNDPSLFGASDRERPGAEGASFAKQLQEDMTPPPFVIGLTAHKGTLMDAGYEYGVARAYAFLKKDPAGIKSIQAMAKKAITDFLLSYPLADEER